jgi:endonuclease VIII-like 1
MPELAEVRLTSEYVNMVVEGKTFSSTWKNPVHKLHDLDLLPHTMGKDFTIKSIARGKEIKLTICPIGQAEFGIMFTLGMGGKFDFNPVSSRAKHTHFSFLTSDGNHELEFVDVRRFGRWKIGDWNPDRSPDLTTEFEAWKDNILQNIGHKDFQRPFFEFLMNQRWINGYGNYLRAELCHRMDIDPFLSAKDIILDHSDQFFEIAPLLPQQAYRLGGGQIYTWNNPLNSEIQPHAWDEWMRAYKNPNYSNIIDRNGRRFWYHPKFTTSEI